MDTALIASAALLGLVGSPHCAAMCSAPCAAVIGRGGWSASVSFHLARVASYGAGGAVAAASVSALTTWSQLSPALRPVWALLNAAAFALGLWLVWKGRQPDWLGNLGRVPRLAQSGPWQRVQGPLRAAAAGGAWAAWPCGLLQSALLVAAMTHGPWAGATAMAAFALASAPGLLLGPWIWRRLLSGGDADVRERWIMRLAGLLIMAASGWALGHGLWERTQEVGRLHCA